MLRKKNKRKPIGYTPKARVKAKIPGVLTALGITVSQMGYAFSPYKKLFTGLNHYSVRVVNATTLESKYFGFTGTGSIDSTAIMTWLGGAAGVVDWVNNEVNPDYPATQADIAKCPQISDGSNYHSDGLKFDGVSNVLDISYYSGLANDNFTQGIIFKSTFNNNWNILFDVGTGTPSDAQLGHIAFINTFNAPVCYYSANSSGGWIQHTLGATYIDGVSQMLTIKNILGVSKVMLNADDTINTSNVTYYKNTSSGARIGGGLNSWPTIYYAGFIKEILLFNMDISNLYTIRSSDI
jgi:hypothetical protein